MVTIQIPTKTQFYNLHTLSGYATGTIVLVTNVTSSTIMLVQSATQPAVDASAFYLVSGKSVVLNTGDNPVWVMGDTGPLVVQDFNSVILPSEAINPRVLVGMEAFTTQSFVEANCKNGTQYEVATYTATFAAGTNRDTIVVTGDKPVLVKNREFTFTGALITTAIYRAPTYTGGAVVPYYNMSDINPQVGQSILMVDATVSNPGTQISPTYNLIGNIPQTGQQILPISAENSLQGMERVLRPNTTYLFRTSNPTAASMIFSSKSTWYEGHLSSIAF